MTPGAPWPPNGNTPAGGPAGVLVQVRALRCSVGRGGVEPPTYHFSGDRSYQLSYLPERKTPYMGRWDGAESA